MDTISLRGRIGRLLHMHSRYLARDIIGSGFSCTRCGWCCRENFKIRITGDILRPSNAIYIFPNDIRRIIRGTGMHWDDIAQPDIYSCLSDGERILAIGWILRRSDSGECIFYREGECSIYEIRPVICRCYPFFIDERGVDVMHCNGLGNEMTRERAEEMARIVRRYEMKKLRSYIRIIEQMGDRLNLANLRALPPGYSGEVFVCDGENIKKFTLLV